ncbi:MAG: helix-turn-helix domain-containing protein [Pseudobdellovibrionaceae bacterium]
MEREVKKAYWIWRQLQARANLDERVEPFLTIPSQNLISDWLRTIRESKEISISQAAKKAEVHKATYAALEKSETAKKISLQTLEKMAEALGCELVYGIRPKSQMPLSLQMWRQILPYALQSYQKRMRSSQIKPMVLARIANQLMEDPKFRRAQGWARRKGSQN